MGTSVPGERTPDKSLDGQTAESGVSWEKQQWEGPGAGDSPRAQKGQCGWSGCETRGHLRTTVERGSSSASGRTTQAEGPLCSRRVGWEAAAATAVRQCRDSLSVSRGSLRLIFRRGRFNLLPFWPVVEEPATEHPGALGGRWEKVPEVHCGEEGVRGIHSGPFSGALRTAQT